MVERRIVWELELMTWLDQGLRQEYIEDLGWECREHKGAKSTRKVYAYEGLKMKMKIRMKNEIKRLIWVNNYIANREKKEWAYVIRGLFRQEMFGVYVERDESLVGLRRTNTVSREEWL
ncbi:hypothetical protein Tco_0802584 [Tanacetum coccineum]|uniref:Reverse transcriptase n=1 Tax=Tanacetum coccineum TaxID=301880 RepID=A0ABQ5A240_9ASTR